MSYDTRDMTPFVSCQIQNIFSRERFTVDGAGCLEVAYDLRLYEFSLMTTFFAKIFFVAGKK